MNTQLTDPLSSVLEKLAPRQVAHDKHDREHWLRTRLTGVTATDAKVCHKGSSHAKAALTKEKLEGGSFFGNKATEWGKLREPVLLAEAGATEYGYLVHAPGNDRHFATPDGLRKTWNGFAVVEGKTSSYDISFGSPKFDEYGYLWQILWQMYCTETTEAIYVWEQHDNDWSRWDDRPRDRREEWAAYGPKPLRIVVEEIILTPQLQDELAKMILAANRFLERLDKRVDEARAAITEEAPEVSEEDAAVERVKLAALETQAKLYNDYLRKEKSAGVDKKAALGELLKLASDRWGDEADSHEFIVDPAEPGELLRIGYGPSGTTATTVPDADAAKLADAELWEKHEAARIAFEAVADQWRAHLANHTTTKRKAVAAAVRVTEKKG